MRNFMFVSLDCHIEVWPCRFYQAKQTNFDNIFVEPYHNNPSKWFFAADRTPNNVMNNFIRNIYNS